jgi:hypothetical protein
VTDEMMGCLWVEMKEKWLDMTKDVVTVMMRELSMAH